MGDSSSKQKEVMPALENLQVKQPENVEPPKPPKNEYNSKQWRNVGNNPTWDSKMEESLMKELKDFDTKHRVTKARVLFIGAVGAGKSSFINSIGSIDKGRLARVVPVGVAGKSHTLKLKEYIPKNLTENVILSDTMGVEADDKEGFNVQDVVYLVQGNVPLDYQFNSRCPIDPEKTERFKKNPAEEDKMHCVVFVIDANVVIEDNIPRETRIKIQQLREKIQMLEVPVVVLLTHIDSLCENLEKTFYSVKVNDAVKMAKEVFGVQEASIFPVKNYSFEGSLEPINNILLLLALRQMMYFGIDFLEMNSHHSSHSEEHVK